MSARKPTVLLLGCGDLGTGVAHRLSRAGMPVATVELAQPRTVRRRVAFAEAARHGEVTVQGVRCRHVSVDRLLSEFGAATSVLLVTEPVDAVLQRLAPDVLVDARMRKRRMVPRPPASIFFVALGPGHVAGRDCDVVVETLRGPELGRVIRAGAAAPDTGIPGDVGGATSGRVLRAPCAGMLRVDADIGAVVTCGQRVAHVGDQAVRSALDGVVRGMLADGDTVEAGQKLGDIDPRRSPPALDAISDKAHAVGEAVLRAVRQRFDLATA